MSWHRSLGKRLALGAFSRGSRSGGRALAVEPLEERSLLSVTLNATFNGLDEFNGRPPDSWVAAGPASLLATVNRQLALFDKEGNTLATSTSVNFFPAAQTVNFNNAFDPWSVYDPYSQRYFVMYEEVEQGTVNADGTGGTTTGGYGADEANILIAISRTDEPSDFTAANWIFLNPIDGTTNTLGDDAWIDYPKIATDADSIYITGNFFSFGAKDYQGVQIIRLDKIDALAGVTTVDARIDVNFTDADQTLHPAQSMFKDAGLPQIFVSGDDGEDGIDVWELDDANVLTNVGDDLGPSWTEFSGGVPQQGSAETLDDLSDRLMNAVDRFGRIWTTHTIEDANGDAAVRWYEIIAPGDGTATFVQAGNIDPGDGIHTWMPAINADLQGNMAIAFNRSASDESASFWVTGRQAGQPLGFTEPPILVATGAAGYAPDPPADVQRWGDYTGLALDPQDNHTFWAFGEVALDNDEWTTRFAQLEITPMVRDEFDLAGTNNSLSTATVLGSLPKITLRDLTIHDEADVDYFQVTAQDTGKLVINVHFQHALGDIDLQLQDRNGNLISSSNSSTDDEQIVVPVVSQQRYFVRVFGFSQETNVYDLEIENFPAPVPLLVDLDTASDTGCLPDDNLTADNTPTFTIVADLANFAIAVLTPAQAAAGNVAGAAVQVYIDGVAAGYASVLFDHVAFTFTAPPLADGFHIVQAAVRVFDGQTPNQNGRTDLGPPLLITIDTTGPSAATGLVNFDLNDSSDSGMSDDDYVTNKEQPAFKGEAEAGAIVRIYAAKVINNVVQPRELVGVGVAGSDPSDGDIDGRGIFEITVEPLVDSLYDITVALQDCAGNVTQFDPDLNTPGPIDVEIDTLAPNLPFLDLLETSDFGRHNDDNVTNDSTPSVSMTTEDRTAIPADFGHKFAANLIYRVFDRLENSAEVLSFDSFAALGNFTSAIQLATTLGPLADGIHDFKLEVEDRAGNISYDFLLDVLIDTVVPPVFFGQAGNAADGLAPESDSDVSPPNPDTIVDRITNDTTPTFWGRAEADAIVRLYADVNGNGALDVGTDLYLGQTTAIPLDGDDAEPDGYWEVRSIVDLNDPNFFPNLDGLRTIFVTAEDLPGNVNGPEGAGDTLQIFIDTQGPVIDNVFITGHGPGDADPYDLFDPKPSTDGPTPLAWSLSIDFTDLPERVAPDFLYDALKREVAEHPGHYLLVGDANGVIPIQDVIVTQFIGPDPVRGLALAAQATVRLVFFEPLPDDRFTLTVSDSIVDPAGNALDGESNAVEPQENPLFPTGDGVPGGDFVARFTIDSRPEIGVWSAGSVYVDTNGNFVFDPQNLDYTNRDLVYALGFTSDYVFAGDFAGPGPDGVFNTADDPAADGFDKLAAFGQQPTGNSRWLVDTDNNGVPNIVTTEGQAIIGHPVAGDFDLGHANHAANGDEIGLFTGTQWFLDSDRNFSLNNNLGAPISFPGMTGGYPIVGDFDGNGLDDLATFQPSNPPTAGTFTFALRLGPATWAPLRVINFQFQHFIGVRERPVAADMDMDGIDDIGLWVPDRSGATPWEAGEWYFLLSDDLAGTKRIVGHVNTLDHAFSPIPLGQDLFAQFGDEFAVPLVGNFDPPTSGQAASADPVLLNLKGTAEGNVLEFTAGAAPGSWTVMLNGVEQGPVSGSSLTLLFDGPAADDQVVVTGSAGNDTVKLRPGRGTVLGEDYRLLVTAESISVHAGGGANSADFSSDPNGADTFEAWPGQARLHGNGFDNWAYGFQNVYASATPGGGDVAYLHDDPGTKDVLKAKPGDVRLFGPGFNARAYSFDHTYAEATPGSGDAAYLYGRPGAADTLEARPEEVTFLLGAGSFNRASGFDFAVGYATPDGGDEAYLFDQAQSKDRLKAWPDHVRLYGDTFHNRAYWFDHTYAYATPGDGDAATLYDDPLAADTFEAWDDHAGFRGPAFDNWAYSFRYVYAIATPGKADAAYLYDSAAKDVLVAAPDSVKLYNSTYSNKVYSFRNVYAYSTKGGYDYATLLDSALEEYPDHLEADANWARLSNDLLGYAYWVSDFEEVSATSSNPSDTKNVNADALDFILHADNW